MIIILNIAWQIATETIDSIANNLIYFKSLIKLDSASQLWFIVLLILH